MLYYSLCFPLLFLLYVVLRRLAFDRRSVALIMLSAMLCYAQFYSSHWQDFSYDASVHTAYVAEIADTRAIPSPHFNAAAHHPPTYYVMGAALYSLAKYTDADPMLAVRHLSMALYFVFIVFSALALRRLLAGRAYFMALALLLFWPLGVTMGGRISSDLLMIAGQMGVLYCMVAWLQERTSASVANAFLCGGVTILAKDSGVIFLAFCGLLLLHALYEYRNRLAALLDVRLFISVALAFLCLYLTLSRSWMLHARPPAIVHTPQDWLARLAFFDPLLFLQETIFSPRAGESAVLFWHWFLRSMPLGQFFGWFSPPLAHSLIFAFGAVWLSMLAYWLIGMAMPKAGHAREKITLWALLGAAAVMISSLMFMQVTKRVPAYAEARYIYPIVTLFALGYGKALEWHERAGRAVMLQVGNGLALGFILLFFALWAMQYALFAGLL
jgi:hypothetical protein